MRGPRVQVKAAVAFQAVLSEDGDLPYSFVEAVPCVADRRAVAGKAHLAHEHAIDPHLAREALPVPEPAVGVARVVVESMADRARRPARGGERGVNEVALLVHERVELALDEFEVPAVSRGPPEHLEAEQRVCLPVRPAGKYVPWSAGVALHDGLSKGDGP